MNLSHDSLSFISLIEQCPTAVHTRDFLAKQLLSRGFLPLKEEESWVLAPGKGYFVHRGQSGLAAFRVGDGNPAETGVSIGVAHTDSPGLKVKILSQEKSNNLLRVGVEVYGSPILSTWFDRELSLAGQIVTLENGSIHIHPVDLKEPLGIIPNLAIHYNRDVNKGGFIIDPQNHLSVLMTLDKPEQNSLEEMLALRLGIEPGKIIDQDLFFYPLQKPSTLDGRLLISGRIDNLSGCHALLEGLTTTQPGAKTQMAFFFEAEEVGSLSLGGAHSSFLQDTVSRIVLSFGGGDEDIYRSRAGGFVISVDAAHALHPNFTDRHDPRYSPLLGGGPVIKLSAGAKYATSGYSATRFEKLCRTTNTPCQRYIIRSDLTSGSTVGPVTGALGGMETVDVGIPILAMHSARETCSLDDHNALIQVLRAFYAE